MQSYDTFHFDSYALDRRTGTIALRYRLGDTLALEETLQLPKDLELRITDEGALDRALFALHLIGGISYFKTCLPPRIAVHSGNLIAEQAKFWDEVYLYGLGEFYYRNAIDFRSRALFPCTKGSTDPLPPADGRPSQALTLIGGGKDSLVSIELLQQQCRPQTLLRVGGHPLIQRLVAATGLGHVEVKRTIDPMLLSLNAQGALNGHVPITAYLSILSIVLSELFGFDAVILSNERSAEAGNTTLFGIEINHQWSKGLRFEQLFQAYLSTYITKNVSYFSLLRPLSELHVTRIFSRYPQYHYLATSCNRNWTIARTDKSVNGERPWCRSCPKCAFVFALYAAMLPEEEVLSIIGGNLFDDESLLPIYRQLLGIEGFKPFECVGTPEETLAAMILAHERGNFRDSAVLQMAMEEATLPDDVHALIEAEFTPSPHHCIPDSYTSLLPL